MSLNEGIFIATSFLILFVMIKNHDEAQVKRIKVRTDEKD